MFPKNGSSKPSAKKSKRKKKGKGGKKRRGGARNDGQTEREERKRGSTKLNTDGEKIINNKNIAFCSK